MKITKFVGYVLTVVGICSIMGQMGPQRPRLEGPPPGSGEELLGKIFAWIFSLIIIAIGWTMVRRGRGE